MNETVTYSVYVQKDTNNNIIAVNSSAFLSDLNGWAKIDEGEGDRYHHAQGNYFDKPIVTDKGIYRYKFVDGVTVEKTDEEIAAEEPIPTEEELALIAKKAAVDALIDGNTYALPDELRRQLLSTTAANDALTSLFEYLAECFPEQFGA